MACSQFHFVGHTDVLGFAAPGATVSPRMWDGAQTPRAPDGSLVDLPRLAAERQADSDSRAAPTWVLPTLVSVPVMKKRVVTVEASQKSRRVDMKKGAP